MISLSPSKLNLMKDCPRCFYDSYCLKIPRPRGMFSTLPGGMDRILKPRYDAYRLQQKLPPEIEDVMAGSHLFGDTLRLKKMRTWQGKGLQTMLFDGEVKLIGGLDDVLVSPEKLFSPLDYKTKGFEPKDSGAQYYQTQVDCYSLMLERNGFKVANEAWLVYYYPLAANAGDGFSMSMGTNISFGCKCYKLQCSQERALGTIRKAADILLGGVRPAAAPECEYCKMIEAKKGL